MNIIGRVTKDAEVRTLSGNRQVVNFSIATNDSYRSKEGERVEQTTYFDCAYWISPKVAEILRKGTLVELSGRVSARAWKGSDGELHAGLNFNTSQIKLHGGVKKEQGEVTATQNKSSRPAVQEPEEDLPF
ncbi:MULTISPECIES: single-stranded DNA-binding protein [Flavobacterium]|uniref:Single-stranded DNA-binding protein n=1 Tax=Flavobacterium johnsoniae (strain ATCC 17061 / DSM 2064 / JCM 8514 / BCRC 14874 / CCUG 350202 / NBRC 14942 / NCIMB 11054 / UW101) TaxID=376686 RepID=A5FFM4_FLAJ1|nr:MULTISPECIES: single-stranded DNA-binding protein [Flavobacterium]ABQ06000.1 single-strand binding protein [Flavobacterium johnsoniae UW101]EJG02250.1 single-strand binding protein [Flavobacterium sp. F52]OXG00629.1 single-stranded DNA-binding protein [Flavobacterium johnsoniae UW101]RXM45556.1 single-stranded DNA-binding protein [Flavobacterium sp. YO64]WJS93537.1 single-stranded DNA-binding protein [Flavobacterium johnsoniae]